MFGFDLFQSFLPLHNPIGFGASDFIEFLLGGTLLLVMLVWRPWIRPYALRFAEKTAWSMLVLAAVPVVLRLALLPHHPVPTPDIYDEFGHLLVADTLRHFRLANPPHALPQFFETFFVLQEPTYSSIYPIGQGLILALGWTVFGHPWAGVIVSVAAFCSLCYWMLRAWTTPGWSFIGGALAVVEFGPLNQWMNSYWGGAVPAAAGCMVFGALPRLRENGRLRDGAWLGVGLALHMLTRQYESIFLALSVILFFLPDLKKRTAWLRLLRPAAVAFGVMCLALGVTLMQNKRVTGSWATLPEALSQYQYGVPAALTFQSDPIPHRELTPQQALDYKMQRGFRGSHGETLTSFFLRLEYRVRYYRFFFVGPLYLALPIFLLTIREFRFAWVLLTLVLFALGVNFFPAFQFHYIAALACLFVLMSVIGLDRLSRLTIRGWHGGEQAATIITCLCIAQFFFWYTLHVFDTGEFSIAARQYETWNAINHGYPDRRIAINQQLGRFPGKLLVFVRYWPQHIFQEEWVYNAADIDGSRIVWARDLGTAENQKLQRYYPDRPAWLLEPDARPPKLSPYRPEPLTNVEGH